MKASDKIDWKQFSPHSRMELKQGKRMIPTFQPHPDWGYQWKPISTLKKKGKQIYGLARRPVQNKSYW